MEAYTHSAQTGLEFRVLRRIWLKNEAGKVGYGQTEVYLKCHSNTCTLYLYYKHKDSLNYSDDNTLSISFDYLDGLDLWVSLSIPE